jgi:hypothetical protein
MTICIENNKKNNSQKEGTKDMFMKMNADVLSITSIEEESARKIYKSPHLELFGNIEDITQEGQYGGDDLLGGSGSVG